MDTERERSKDLVALIEEIEAEFDNSIVTQTWGERGPGISCKVFLHAMVEIRRRLRELEEKVLTSNDAQKWR